MIIAVNIGAIIAQIARIVVIDMVKSILGELNCIKSLLSLVFEYCSVLYGKDTTKNVSKQVTLLQKRQSKQQCEKEGESDNT